MGRVLSRIRVLVELKMFKLAMEDGKTDNLNSLIVCLYMNQLCMPLKMFY